MTSFPCFQIVTTPDKTGQENCPHCTTGRGSVRQLLFIFTNIYALSLFQSIRWHTNMLFKNCKVLQMNKWCLLRNYWISRNTSMGRTQIYQISAPTILLIPLTLSCKSSKLLVNINKDENKIVNMHIILNIIIHETILCKQTQLNVE